MNLTDGQDIVILTIGGDFYINNAAAVVGSSFTQNGSTVVPSMIDQVESDGAQSVTLKTGQDVIDNNGNSYKGIVGGHPKTRPRR